MARSARELRDERDERDGRDGEERDQRSDDGGRRKEFRISNLEIRNNCFAILTISTTLTI
jgi:hypothetical protein